MGGMSLQDLGVAASRVCKPDMVSEPKERQINTKLWHCNTMKICGKKTTREYGLRLFKELSMLNLSWVLVMDGLHEGQCLLILNEL